MCDSHHYGVPKNRSLLSEEGTPEQHREILFWQFRHAMPSPDQRPALFGEVARTCRASSNPIVAVDQFLVEAEHILNERDLVSLYVALVGEAEKEEKTGAGDLESGLSEELVNRFRMVINSNTDERSRWEMRRMAAACGGTRLLAKECVAELFPWSSESAGSRLRAWIDQVWHGSTEVAIASAREIRRRTEQLHSRGEAAAILEQCSSIAQQRIPNLQPVLIAFQEAKILSVPLASFSQLEIGKREVESGSYSAAAKASIEVSRNMESSPQIPNTKRPDLMALRQQCPDLPQLVFALDDRHWNEACCWLLSGFFGALVENEETVKAVVDLILFPLSPRARDDGHTVGGNDLSRAERAMELVANQLSSELLHGRYRKDFCTHACSLATLVCTAAKLAPGAYSMRQSLLLEQNLLLKRRVPSIAYLIAGVVGRVFADDSALPKKLVWARVKGRNRLQDAAWKYWLRGFRRAVNTARRARVRKRNKLLMVMRFFGRLLGKKKRPGNRWEFDQTHGERSP